MRIVKQKFRGVCILGEVLALATIIACAPGKVRPVLDDPTQVQTAGTDSHVDITYVLGHNSRRFNVEATPGEVRAWEFLDQKVIGEGPVDQNHYATFLQKALECVDSASRAPSSHAASSRAASSEDESCRAPFKVTVRVGKDSKISKGCRGVDEGCINRLVKDGEFLLYSQKR